MIEFICFVVGFVIGALAYRSLPKAKEIPSMGNPVFYKKTTKIKPKVNNDAKAYLNELNR